MRILPHKLYLLSLAEDEGLRRRNKLIDKQIAYLKLKELTGQDFGYDVTKWEEWMNNKSTEEIYSGYKNPKHNEKDKTNDNNMDNSN